MIMKLRYSEYYFRNALNLQQIIFSENLSLSISSPDCSNDFIIQDIQCFDLGIGNFLIEYPL